MIIQTNNKQIQYTSTYNINTCPIWAIPFNEETAVATRVQAYTVYVDQFAKKQEVIAGIKDIFQDLTKAHQVSWQIPRLDPTVHEEPEGYDKFLNQNIEELAGYLPYPSIRYYDSIPEITFGKESQEFLEQAMVQELPLKKVEEMTQQNMGIEEL